MRGLMLQEKGELGMDGLLADHVIVVQEQHPGRRGLGKSIDEYGEHGLELGRKLGLQERQDLAKVAGSALIQRRE